jgi:hypothetical protein
LPGAAVAAWTRCSSTRASAPWMRTHCPRLWTSWDGRRKPGGWWQSSATSGPSRKPWTGCWPLPAAHGQPGPLAQRRRTRCPDHRRHRSEPSNLTSDPSRPKAAARPVQDGFLAAQVSRSGDVCGRRLPLAGFRRIDSNGSDECRSVHLFGFGASGPFGVAARIAAPGGMLSSKWMPVLLSSTVLVEDE